MSKSYFYYIQYNKNSILNVVLINGIFFFQFLLSLFYFSLCHERRALQIKGVNIIPEAILV